MLQFPRRAFLLVTALVVVRVTHGLPATVSAAVSVGHSPGFAKSSLLLPVLPRPPVRAAIALGSNIGDRRAHIEFAFRSLGEITGTRLFARSEIHETAPVAVSHADPGGAYLNAAVVIDTSLSPGELLHHLHAIEQRCGRDRMAQPHGAARTLDLDLLLYAQDTITQPGLMVPHPRLCERLFVLEPLAEIAPSMPVPGLNRTVSQLLCELRSRQSV